MIDTLASDIAAQMQGAVDELNHALKLLAEMRENETYSGVSFDEIMQQFSRIDAAKKLLELPMPPTLQKAADWEQERMDDADKAADAASY